MSRPFTSNIEKDLIRINWNTPVLRYLHDQYGIKYRYLGLPGVDIIDVLLWKDMIEEVIAFEQLIDGGRPRKNIIELRANLKRNLIPHCTYVGSIEEVIILRKDFENQQYSQGNVITLYNLDFCDEISSKIHTIERGIKAWRYEAIRTIFTDQKTAYINNGRKPNTFILLITIRNQIYSTLLKELLRDIKYASSQARLRYFDEQVPLIPNDMSLLGNHGWAIKIFLYEFLCNCLYSPNITALFFPTILYNGTPTETTTGTIPSPMMHLMIFCQFANPESATPDIFPNNVLSFANVEIKDSDFVWQTETPVDIIPGEPPNSRNWLDQHVGNLLNTIVV
jgi:hypothetical protein